MTTDSHHRSYGLTVARQALLSCAFVITGTSAIADSVFASSDVEIKKHSTGKRATVREGEKEWFIHIDVDQDRTRISRSESDTGRETTNQAEMSGRPSSNSGRDRVVNVCIGGCRAALTRRARPPPSRA